MNNDILIDDDDENSPRINYELWGKKIIEAAKKGNLQDIKSTIEEGGDPNYADDKNWNALSWASYYGYPDIIEFMIEKKVNSEYRDRARSILANSSKLFEQFRINTYRVSTPLHWAAYNGHTTAVSVLITNGYLTSDKDEEGNSPLHLSSSQGHIEVVELLLSFGSHVSLRNHYGHTPLDLATNKNVRKLLKSLSDQKACDGCRTKFDIEVWPLYCSSCYRGYCMNCSSLKNKHIKKGSPTVHITRYCDSCLKEITHWEDQVIKNSTFEGGQIDEIYVAPLEDALRTANDRNVDSAILDKGESEFGNLISSLALEQLMEIINLQRPIKTTELIDELRKEMETSKTSITNQTIKLKADELLKSITLEKKVVGNIELCSKIECATLDHQKDINRIKIFLDQCQETNIDTETYEQCFNLYNKMVNEVNMASATYVPKQIAQDPPPEDQNKLKKKKKKVEIPIVYHYIMEDGTEINTLLECLRIRVGKLKTAVEDSERYQIYPPLLETGKKMLEELTAQLNVEEEIETKRLEAEEAKRKKAARRKGKK